MTTQTKRNDRYRQKKMALLANNCEKVLDIGCSLLPNEFLLNKHVTGFDIMEAKMPDNYSDFVQGSADNIKEIFGESVFDAILCGEVIEHLLNPIQFLIDCNFILKDGGVLVLSTPNPNDIVENFLTLTLNEKYYYSSDHVCLFPQRWLKRMLKISSFKNIKICSGGFSIPFLCVTIPSFRPFASYTIAVSYK